jgi:hypothetical protein
VGLGIAGSLGCYWLTHPQRRISHYVFTLAETQVPVWPSSGKRSRRYPCWTWTGGRREPARNYAASCLKLVDTLHPGKRANALAAETHTNRCSSTSYLARSISTFFLAASLVQARKHSEERASMYSRTPASYIRFRSLQIGQSIPAPLRRSAGLTVAWMRSWFKNCLKA